MIRMELRQIHGINSLRIFGAQASMTLMPSRKAKAKAKAHHSVIIVKGQDIMHGNVVQQRAREKQVQGPDVTYVKVRDTQGRSVPAKEGASTRRREPKARIRQRDLDGEEKEKGKERARIRGETKDELGREMAKGAKDGDPVKEKAQAYSRARAREKEEARKG